MVYSTAATHNSFCEPCPSGCEECVFTAGWGLNCTLCLGTQYLINGTCRATCPIGTYVSPSSSSCTDCNIVVGCQACIFNSSLEVECTICQSGFFLMADSLNCTTSCPSGYMTEGTRCVPNPICYNYKYQGYCLSTCPSGTYPYDPNFCPAGSICTTQWQEKTCQNCALNCLICYSTTFCERCSNTTVMYTDTNSSSCMSFCPSGFYNSSGICIACPSSCGNCFFSTTEGQARCSSCGPGKIIFNGQCLTTCPSGYF